MNNFDIFEIEKKFRAKFRLAESYSLNKNLLFKLIEFFDQLFEQENPLIIEAYITESIEKLLVLFNNYSAFGIQPEYSEKIITFLKILISKEFIQDYHNILEENLIRIKHELTLLNQTLEGLINKVEWSEKVSFPLIEQSMSKDVFGSIDKINITLKQDADILEDEFLVVPSLPNLDTKIENQLKLSWNYAKLFVEKNENRIIPKTKIVVKFEKKLGIYIGDSIGTAITLGFISKLTNNYNIRNSYKINKSVLFTGILEENGDIAEIGKEIIEKKTRIAFYSHFNSMVISSTDYPYAIKILSEEKEKYPQRQFDIIPVNNLNEILSNKNLILLTHISFFNYYANYLKSNKFAFTSSLISILILISTVLYFSFVNVDQNSIKEVDFIKSMKENGSFSKDKFKPVNGLGEVFKFNFDKKDLLKSRDSGNFIFHNIELTKNRFNEKGKAFRFNGDDSEINLGDKPELKIPLPLSISVWFKKTDMDEGWIFANDYDDKNLFGVLLGFDDGNILTWRYGNSGKIGLGPSRGGINAINPIELWKWYHLVGVMHDYGNYQIFLNGRKISVFYIGTRDEIQYSNGYAVFGKYRSSSVVPVFFFKGDLDDFRLFDRALNEKEIEQLFYER